MRKFWTAFIVLLLGFSGCAAPVKECGTDKACLQESFGKCENAHGTWSGGHGSIEVNMGNKSGDTCTVAVTIRKEGLEITNRTMVCTVPLNASEAFSIGSDCSGELTTILRG